MSSTGDGGKGGLWRHRDFRKLWAGETVSLFGSEVTELALPLVAVLALDAGAGQMGLLAATRFAPVLLVTLPAGVWVDRRRRRPVLIGANLGRCLLVALVPLLAGLGALRIQHLYGIAFAVGVLTVLFDVACQSYLPSLVDRGQLVEGNGRLQASASVARVGGPGLGGLLVQLAGAPRALLLDAASFAVSAATLLAIRQPEPAPPGPATGAPRAGLRREIGEGLAVTYRNPVLRSMAGLAATYNLFAQVIEALLVLYATTELSMAAGLIGLVVAAGSVGALGELLGLRAAVAVGAVGSLLTVPWVLARPLPGLRRMPAQLAPR